MASLYFGDGRKIDPFNFSLADIDPVMMGRGLARIARFAGAGTRSVSVAYHSRNLSLHIGDDINHQRAALVHDVPELFTGDVPGPIKRMCPDLCAIDARIIERLGLVLDIPAQAFRDIHEKDVQIAEDEKLFMFKDLSEEDRARTEAGKMGIRLFDVTDDHAARIWTARFYELFPES